MKEKIVQGNFKPHHWWQTKQFLIAAGLVVLTGMGGGLWVSLHHTSPPSKKPTQQPTVVNPVPTQQQIQQAQDDVTVNGTVQSFDGTIIKFVVDGSNQHISVSVAATTTYTQGLSYAPATASGLKAGLQATTITYNTKTNVAVAVAYGQ